MSGKGTARERVPSDGFPTTRWSLVARAGGRGIGIGDDVPGATSEHCQESLNHLLSR